jgi:hypothetical protein
VFYIRRVGEKRCVRTSLSLAVEPERTKAREWLPGRSSEISLTFTDYAHQRSKKRREKSE